MSDRFWSETMRVNWSKIKHAIVKSYLVTKDKIIIEFEDIPDKIVIYARADCCSNSEFIHEPDRDDSNLDVLIGQKILKASALKEEVARDQVWSVRHQEGDKTQTDEILTKYYRYFILTQSGMKVSIMLCNVSNGYYDGWVDMFLE